MMSDGTGSRRRELLDRSRQDLPRGKRPAWQRVRRIRHLEYLERRELLAQYALGTLLLDGAFTQSGSTLTASGPVEIGYAPTSTEAFNPLTIWDGTLSFTSGGSSFDFSGTVQAIEQSADLTIGQVGSTATISVASLTSTGASLSGSAFGVEGASFTPSSLALIDPAGGDTTASYVSLQGQLGFSELAGLSVPVSGTNFVELSPAASAPSLTLAAAASASPFEAFGVDFSPVSLSVGYATGSGQFQFSGSVGMATTSGDFSASGSLGTSTAPGLIVNSSGAVTQLSVTIASQISLKGLTLSVDNVQFFYENDSTSIYNGDFLIEQGSVTIATSAGDTVFAASFGANGNPGMAITDGSLTNLYVTVSSTVSVQSLDINAANLVFQYEGGSDSFEIASGSVSIASGPLQFASATFGVPGTPGLLIKNGVLTGLDVSISSNMSVDGMSLSISQMQLVYYAVSGQTDGNFEIAAGGSVSLSAGPSSNTLTLQGTFGTTQNGQSVPGLSISNGVLQSFYIAVTSSISLGGSLTLSTSGLTFAYDAPSQTFQIPSGSVSVVDTSGDFNFTGTFGSTLSDGTTALGLVVSNGALSELNVSVTSQLKAASLTFKVDNLDFYYNATGNQYEIDSGSLSFDTNEGFSFSATFGLPSTTNPGTNLPGLVISGGALTEFNASLTSSFTVAGLVIDVNDMSMSYGSGEYEMDGTVTVSTSNVSFTGTIGQPSASPPVYGLIIDNGSLKSLAITINSNVTFGDLTLQAQNLAFNYDASPESFTLYGTVTTSIAGVTLVGTLGTQSSPGLSIVNGQLTELNLGVTTDFTLFGLECDVQDLTFQYESSQGNTDYILYGGLSLSISGNTISATLGSATDAGLIIQNGVVTQINMTINGSFSISGFEFDINDAGLDYTSTNNEYLIFGTFTLTDVFSASVQLGTGSNNPGITVINGVFELDNFAFTLSNVAMGGFTLNYVTISYASAGDVWSGSGMVTFPTGWSITASLTFVNGNLDDISLAYNAGTSEGIEIPDTGVFVTEISASVENIDEPASIIVSGTIQAVFGGKISIGGTTCTIFAATGSFTADSQELTITGNYYEGAYETNNQWHDILGGGSATVDLDWAAGVYTASISESLYDGTFVISASVAFDDSGDFAIEASASVNVPDAVPFIGGEQLGSMDFAFIYTASSNTGTVAAWCNVNCYFTTVTTGFQYTFDSGSTGDFSLIGAGGVSDIENQFNSIASADNSTPPTYVYSYSVTVPSGSGANGLSVQAMWPSNDGTQTLLISGPNDNGTYYSVSSSSLPSNDDFLTSYTTSTSQSVMTTGSATDPTVLLPAGTYNFEIQSTYEFGSTSDVTFTNQLYYEAPSVSITSVPSAALTFIPSLSGFAAGALASGTTVTLYAQSSSTGYNGKEVGSFGYSVNSSGQLQNVPSIDLSSYSPGVPIYIYAVINDGVNTPVYSAVSSPITPVPNLVGRIIDQFGNPISGIRVFLDLNNDQTYDAPVTDSTGAVTQPGDPSMITNAAGYYYFNDLESYTSSDVGYPTFRVMALMPSPSFTPITPSSGVDTITNTAGSSTSSTTTTSITANFTINRLASITGSLYSDLNKNGVYVSTDPSLAGATVYLDSSGTGTYQAGDPTCITGPSGTFGFYDLNPTSYTSGILTSTTANNITTNLYVVTQPSSGTYTIPITSDAQQLTGYTFGVISLATISGNVSSETTQGSSTSALSGVTVDLTTPNLSASVPDYSNFSSTSNLKLINSTASSSGTLTVLGSSQSNAATAAWYKTAVPVSSGFEATFQWSLSSTSGSPGGFAFVLQNAGTSSTGSTAYGYGGIGESLAVIFDAANNEVMLESGGNTSASSAIAVLSSAQLGFTLASGTAYTARVTYLPSGTSGTGTLNVYLSGDSSGGSTPVLSAAVNLSTLLSLGSAGTAYLGFTGGTSGSGITASVASWTVTALTTQTTTTDSYGNYTFTGLMPGLNYAVSQVAPAGYIQASPTNTKGVYSQSSTSTSNIVESSVATGDFNGDGIPDAAYASSLWGGTPFQITYALGNGEGGFNTAVTVTLPLTLTAPKLATPTNGIKAFDAYIVAGHFDTTARDDIAYLATMAKGGHVIVVYDVAQNKVVNEIEVESTTAPQTTLNVGAGYSGTINNIAVGDLNNDGYDDLAVSTYGGVYTLTSLRNLAVSTSWTVNPATLATPLLGPTLQSSSAVGYNAGVALADFNQDGNLDLVSMGVQYIPDGTSWTDMTVATSIQLAYGTGSGSSYSAQSPISFQSYSSTNIDAYFSSTWSAPTYPIPFGMAAADVSGDLIPDLELNGYTSTLQPAVFLLTQSAPGSFTAASTATIPNGKAFNINNTPGPDNTIVPGSLIVPSQILPLDLNGDGYGDVAAVDPNVGQLLLLSSLAAPLTSGQAENLQEFGGGALPQFGQADYNLDGYPDLIVPGMNDYPYQLEPVLIENGTINVGVISYTPTNGQALTGQNFNDIAFSGSTISASAVSGSGPHGVSGAHSTGAGIFGRVFLDSHRNGRFAAGEAPLSGLIVYLDTQRNGRFNPAVDPYAYTNAQGYYAFTNLTPGQTYIVRVANLSWSLTANPVVVTLPRGASNVLVERYIAVTQRWTVPRAVVSGDPLVPIVIDLAPLPFRDLLKVRPLYELTGNVPQGMTIDPYKGIIEWIPSMAYAGKTVTVSVRVINSLDRSPLEAQSDTLQIRISAPSPYSAYIRDVYGALLGRLPSPGELNNWSSRLQAGTTPSSFVTSLSHTDEHYTVLADSTYLNVLGRRPNPAELASALALYRSDGNSDQLTQKLLSSPAFSRVHRTNLAFVQFVDQIVTGGTLSHSQVKRQLAWLRLGMSRGRLVKRVSASESAVFGRVRPLVGRYLGITPGEPAYTNWVELTSEKRLNSDALLVRILASHTYLNGSQDRAIPGLPPRDAGSSPQYNRLNHLAFAMDGVDANRPQLDSMEAALYAGQTWNQMAEGVYNSQAAFDYRVEKQYRNLIHRSATAAELSSLEQSLPPGNQVDALTVQILSGGEYRRQYATTADYVTAVYQTLTGTAPNASTQANWVQKLNAGATASQFVDSVNASRAGQIGQIDRNYLDFLLRDPSQLELDYWLGTARQGSLQDRAIALALVNSPEFQSQQRTARLLPLH